MKLNLNKKKKISRKIGEQSFSVVPYVDLAKKSFILDELIQYYNNSKEVDNFTKNLLEYRANFDILILKAVTDIEITEEDNYEDMISSGLIDIIRKTVINYDEIYQDALFMLECSKLAGLISKLDVGDILNDLPKFLDNMSPETLERLQMVEKVTAKDAVLKAVKGGIIRRPFLSDNEDMLGDTLGESGQCNGCAQ